MDILFAILVILGPAIIKSVKEKKTAEEKRRHTPYNRPKERPIRMPNKPISVNNIEIEEENIEEEESLEMEEISIDDFDKVKLRLGEIVECEDHPNADKLLVLQVDFGDEKRQIVSGIKKWYKKEDLLGKKVVCVVNLKATKLRGVESNGMILAASEKDDLSLLSTLEDLPKGAWIS